MFSERYKQEPQLSWKEEDDSNISIILGYLGPGYSLENKA